MADCLARLTNVVRILRDQLVFYKGSFTSDLAKQITQVHVFERGASKSGENHVAELTMLDEHEGYQRPAARSRQHKFAAYLKKKADGTTFAPPVILNARGHWEFEPESEGSPYGTLCIRGPANIIDGQHRLGGFIKHFLDDHEPRSVDFIAYDNLKHEQEKWVFHTINTTQKGVPAALSVIIDDTEWQNRVARKIATESSSPFMNKISMAGQPGKQYLWKLNAIAKNLERMFKSGAFKGVQEEEIYDIFGAYWEKIRDTHSDAWEDFDRDPRDRTHKLLELTGLVAYCRLFDFRFSHRYNSGTHTVDWPAVESDLEEIAARLELTKDGEFKGQTGEYGAGQVLLRMQEILAQPASI